MKIHRKDKQRDTEKDKGMQNDKVKEKDMKKDIGT